MPISTVKEVTGPPPLLKTLSKRHVFGRRIRPVLRVSLCLLIGVAGAHSQTTKVEISVTSLSPARIRIHAELPAAANALSFRNAYAGILGLGERIENLEATNADGQTIEIRKLAPGEFQSNEKFLRVTYDVSVPEPARPSDLSHISWLNSERGLLMLGDLLPQSVGRSQSLKSASVSILIPKNWRVAANIGKVGSQFVTDDLETAIFLVGPTVQEKKQRFSASNFSLITSGEWPFSNGDAVGMARWILEENSRVTGSTLRRAAFLMLLPYPGDAGPEKWSAETRGNTVVLVLGQKGSRKRVLSKLGIVLSHELFHLWVPNSLQLQGDYDWFFEGFTLYQALRTDLRLGLITFDDYLTTIARVYDSYRANAELDKLSLIEASERRWTNSPSLVYEKGMLVAFVYDLALRSQTNCGASLEDVYAEVFRLPATGQANGNKTIIRILTAKKGMASFAKSYIENPAVVSLTAGLEPFGIQLQPRASGVRSTQFSVRRDLNESQRKLLGCIGYKN